MQISDNELLLETEQFGGIALYAHPFYEWVDMHINEMNNKVFFGVITNVVSLGDMGLNYFMRIAMKRKGSFTELMNIYTSIGKMIDEGFISVCTYDELFSLGYKGDRLDGESPLFEATEFISKSN